ncbi:MAG: prepilin-type N-terminal cleavage/methylation domain-containing protein [Planctomycetes bacterium]|nr:prepilin-type N-terminal cleavage/methylation domain-containing protein [Planctomycetota bacterium]
MKHSKRHFTLIELLVVVTILATLAGAILASYDGLEEKAAQGQAAHSLGTLDSTLRTYKVLNKAYPDQWDSLLVGTTTGTDTLSATFSATSATPIVSLPPKLAGKLGPHQLTGPGLAALNGAGITSLRYIGSTLADSSGIVGNAEAGSIPNRAFDNTGRGRGVSRTLAIGDHVAIVEGLAVADFGGSTPSDSSRLRDIGGLDETRAHVVVAVGIGNNSTLVKSTSGATGGLSEAPTYSNLPKDQYGRYIALFHLGSSTDATIGNVVYLSSARLLAVVDTKGDWLDEEIAEFTGQKN